MVDSDFVFWWSYVSFFRMVERVDLVWFFFVLRERQLCVDVLHWDGARRGGRA